MAGRRARRRAWLTPPIPSPPPSPRTRRRCAPNFGLPHLILARPAWAPGTAIVVGSDREAAETGGRGTAIRGSFSPPGGPAPGLQRRRRVVPHPGRSPRRTPTRCRPITSCCCPRSVRLRRGAGAAARAPHRRAGDQEQWWCDDRTEAAGRRVGGRAGGDGGPSAHCRPECTRWPRSRRRWPGFGSKAQVEAPDRSRLHRVAETSYAPCGGLSLAYQVFGDGPVELVYAGSFVSHLEMFWTMPEFEAFMERISTFCRVLLFDKAGVGSVGPRPAGAHARRTGGRDRGGDGCRGVRPCCSVRVERGRPAAMLFAATRPERTQALILAGTFAYFGITEWADFDRDPSELHARILTEMGEDYALDRAARRLSGIRPRQHLGSGVPARHSNSCSRTPVRCASSGWSSG